jgi:hypothetical protein
VLCLNRIGQVCCPVPSRKKTLSKCTKNDLVSGSNPERSKQPAESGSKVRLDVVVIEVQNSS